LHGRTFKNRQPTHKGSESSVLNGFLRRRGRPLPAAFARLRDFFLCARVCQKVRKKYRLVSHARCDPRIVINEKEFGKGDMINIEADKLMEFTVLCQLDVHAAVKRGFIFVSFFS
jgi:hypothetical protein